MKLIFITLLFLYSMLANAELTNPPKSLEAQYFLNSNRLTNPGFESGNTGWTSTGAAISTVNLSNFYEGRSLSWDPTASSKVCSNSITFQAGEPLFIKGMFQTTDTNYKLQLVDTSGPTVIMESTINASSSYIGTGFYSSLNSSKNVQLCISANGNLGQIYADDMYLGRAPFFGYTSDYSSNYTAKVVAAGTVSDENRDFINGNAVVSATSTYTFTFNTGLFTKSPTCTATTVTGGASTSEASVTSVSTTTLVVRTSSSAGTGTASDFNISCSKSEPDSGFAVRMDQTNFGMIDQGATVITATTTAPTKPNTGITTDKWTYERLANKAHSILKYRQTVTTGAANGSGDYLFQVVPTGLSIDSNAITGVDLYTTVIGNNGFGPNNIVGTCIWSNSAGGSGTVIQGYAVAYDATRVRCMGAQYSGGGFSGGAAFNSATGLNFATAAAVNFIIDVTVPISGWTQNQNAPLIVGGVTSSYSGTKRLESAYILNSGTASIDSQYGSWISSVTRNGTGDVSVNIASGMFSQPPHCTVSVMDQGNADNANCFPRNTTTTSLLRVICEATTTGTDTDFNFYVICTGPR